MAPHPHSPVLVMIIPSGRSGAAATQAHSSSNPANSCSSSSACGHTSSVYRSYVCSSNISNRLLSSSSEEVRKVIIRSKEVKSAARVCRVMGWKTSVTRTRRRIHLLCEKERRGRRREGVEPQARGRLLNFPTQPV